MFLSECTSDGRFEFIYVAELRDFDNSEIGCNQLEPTASLASIPSIETSLFINQFLGNLSASGAVQIRTPWIGLRRDEDFTFSQGTNLEDPKLFRFTDGTELPEGFGGTKSVFPWQISKPDNRRSNESCGL